MTRRRLLRRVIKTPDYSRLFNLVMQIYPRAPHSKSGATTSTGGTTEELELLVRNFSLSSFTLSFSKRFWLAAVVACAAAPVALAAGDAYDGQAEWAQRYDADPKLTVSRSTTPISRPRPCRRPKRRSASSRLSPPAAAGLPSPPASNCGSARTDRPSPFSASASSSPATSARRRGRARCSTLCRSRRSPFPGPARHQ